MKIDKNEIVPMLISIFIGAPFTITVFLAISAFLWKPNFSTVKNFVYANNIGKQIYKDDPKAEFCHYKGWFSRDYYIKSNDKIYYIGFGVYSMKFVSNQRINNILDNIPDLFAVNKTEIQNFLDSGVK